MEQLKPGYGSMWKANAKNVEVEHSKQNWESYKKRTGGRIWNKISNNIYSHASTASFQ